MTKQTVILSIAFALSACGTVNTIPLDDAYIWPDKKEVAQTQTTQTPEVQSEPAVEQTPATTMEIISQQDTTITVRIKK